MFWRMGLLFILFILLKKMTTIACSEWAWFKQKWNFLCRRIPNFRTEAQKTFRYNSNPKLGIDYKIKFTLKHCPQRSPDLWKMKNWSPGSGLELGRRGILTCCRCPHGLDIKALLVVRPLMVLACIILWSKAFLAQFNQHQRKPFRCFILPSTPLGLEIG